MLASAGVEEYDAGHSALTHMAANGSTLGAIIGHSRPRSMATTKRYLHLAGVTFEDDASSARAARARQGKVRPVLGE